MLDETPHSNPNETPDTRQAMKQYAESISLEDAQ